MADEATDSIASLLEAVRKRFKSPKSLVRYSNYIEYLSCQGLPVLFSFNHLADSIGIQPYVLRSMAFASEYYYQTFDIPKRSGGFRVIQAPHPDLAFVQNWISDRILKPSISNLNSCVTAYMPERSILDHVAPHLGSIQLLKLDIKDFFPCISTNLVCSFFKELGYSWNVARTLAALTTVNGALPQGAPSSPRISNLVMRGFDDAMLLLCKEQSLSYTRYADDLVVSGLELNDIQVKIERTLADFGFRLNHTKSKAYLDQQSPRFLTGLLVQDTSIRLPKKARRRIRIQSHLFIERLKSMLAEKRQDFVDKKNSIHPNDQVDDVIFAERILGRLQFWSWIEKDHRFPRETTETITELLKAL